LGSHRGMVTHHVLGAILLVEAHASLRLQLQVSATGPPYGPTSAQLRHLSVTLHAIGAATFDT
jgi:hypothetical protein